jgi:hypothetical protein
MGHIFVVWNANPATPDNLRMNNPPMLLASVVAEEMVERPPCLDFQPRESSNQSVDLVYC